MRDHREVPGDAAQWTIRTVVDSLNLHTLANVVRNANLAASGSGLSWANSNPNSANMIFENCTRPGEVVYSSDLVGIRFGTKFLRRTGGTPGLGWGDQRACEFRLVPSGPGMVPAGSGDGKFAIYSVPANAYLIYKSAGPFAGVFGGLGWQATANGRPPHDVAAHADFVPVELFFTQGTINNNPVQTAYMTIRNIGSVPSSASQREMKVRIGGEEFDFLVLNPVPPGAVLTRPLPVHAALNHCQKVLVQLDTRPDLKFQVGPAAFPTDSVFANDQAVLFARNQSSTGPRALPCDAGRIGGQ